MFAVVVFGVIVVGFGIFSLAAGDAMWGLTEWSNSWNGRASERTDLWEIRRVVGGIIAIVVGIVLVLIGLSLH